MRQLKFRIWSGIEMIYDVTVGRFGVFYVNPGYKGDGLDPQDSACLTPHNTKYPEGTPVMQFTGMKDTKGKDIYEGDVLQDGAVVEWFNELTWDSGGSRHSGFYCGKWLDGDTDLSYHDSFDDCEIIGNIYENPELLKPSHQQ